MTAEPLGVLAPVPRAGGSLRLTLRRLAFTRSGRLGLVLLSLELAVIVAGPWLAPHEIDEIVGPPYAPPSGTAPLGTDYLGEDVLSRFLHGGLLIVAVAIVSACLAYAVGAPLGLLAGYAGGWRDSTISSVLNILLAVPPVVLALLLIAGIGSGVKGTAIAIAAVLIAPVARIVRTLTVEIMVNPYVEVARLRGESMRSVIQHEVLPNLAAPMAADLGVRLAYAIILFAAFNFLGLGQSAPGANWGLMIAENRAGLLISPWAVAVPAIAIAVLVVGLSFVLDSWIRALTRMPNP